MPIYEYRCKKCQHVFEEICKSSEDSSDISCPKCGKNGAEKLLSAFCSLSSGGGVDSSPGGSCGSGGFS